jgi:16S rRNA (guanine1207-N2)-methyltransferase
MEVMEIEAGARVLDIGCGSGTVALAAAVRAPGVSVHGIDSNPRAVECLLRGAALNNLANLTGLFDAEGTVPEPSRFDLVLANPPYYSNFRIAEIFLAAGRRALRPGGKLLLVTKMPDWYLRTLPERFDQVRARKARDYIVVEAVKRRL